MMAPPNHYLSIMSKYQDLMRGYACLHTPCTSQLVNHTFSPQVQVMSSMRKPKKVIIRGDNEREYPFLIKGGEDLRQDQRIEQVSR